MSRAMLEYTKTVLRKVSFDVRLFKRELKKAVSRLLPFEIEELRRWLQQFLEDKPQLKPTLVYLES